MQTSASENKQLVRRFIEEGFNQGTVSVLDELFAAEYVGHTPSRPEPIRGPEGMREYIESTRAGIPDVELDIEHMLAEDDLVATYWIGRGTHEGELMGVPPTENTYEAPGMEISRIREGKIVEGWHVGDRMGMLQQLGILSNGP